MLDISQRTTVSNDSDYMLTATSNLHNNIRTATDMTTTKTTITMSSTAATTTTNDWQTYRSNATKSLFMDQHGITTTLTAPALTQNTIPFLAWSPIMQENSNNSSALPALISNMTTNTTTYPNTPSSYVLPANMNSSSNNYNLSTSTVTTPLMDDDNEVLRTIEYIGSLLSFYYVPIIVCTGSLGNILSVVVFFKTKLRKLSSSIYLGALAVSDTCFLLGLFAQWLNFVDINIYNREYFCQFFTFFSNLACFCSNWFVVAFTVERFIAVMYPLKRQTMCTVRRAKMVLLGLTLLGCMHCAPFLISSRAVYSPKAEMTLCDIKSEYKDYITILNYWDTVVVFAIPFVTIAVLNTFTGCTVWKFATVRRTLTMQKVKNHNLHQHHETIVSTPLISQCDMTKTVSTATTASAVAMSATQTAEQQQQLQKTTSTNYRLSGIPATTTLKRNKLHCCCATAMTSQHNGHENNCTLGAHVEPHMPHTHRSSMKAHQQFARHQHSSFSSTHSHQQHQRSFTMGSRNCCSASSTCTDLSRKSGRRKSVNSSQLKVTKMLLIVSTVFVCLNLPSFIMRMITFLETQASTNAKTTIVLQYIFQLFFITNFGINFVLYCVSGQNFRKAFFSIIRRVPNTQRDVTTQVTSKYVSEFFCNNSGCGQQITGPAAAAAAAGGNTSVSSVSFKRNLSSRRRMLMTENSWNEMHEMQCKK